MQTVKPDVGSGETSTRPDPDWPRACWNVVHDDVVAYRDLFWRIIITPRRFLREWAEGTRPVINPVVAVFNGTAVIGIFQLLWSQFTGRVDDIPWWMDFLRPVLVFPLVIASVVPAHLVARALGSERQLRTSIGAVLLLVSGPIVCAIIGWKVMLHGPDVLHSVAGNLVLIFEGVYFALGLAGVHRLSWWRIALVLACLMLMVKAGEFGVA